MNKLSQTGDENNLPLLRTTRKTLPYKNLRLTILKKKRWNVSTPMLCNKMCVRKLRHMFASEPTWMRTPYIWVYGFSLFEIHWVLALCPFLAPTRTPMKCWILTGCARTPERLICACTCAHADICVTITTASCDQDKLSLCYGLSWQMDTSKVTFNGVSALK